MDTIESLSPLSLKGALEAYASPGERKALTMVAKHLVNRSTAWFIPIQLRQIGVVVESELGCSLNEYFGCSFRKTFRNLQQRLLQVTRPLGLESLDDDELVLTAAVLHYGSMVDITAAAAHFAPASIELFHQALTRASAALHEDDSH